MAEPVARRKAVVSLKSCFVVFGSKASRRRLRVPDLLCVNVLFGPKKGFSVRLPSKPLMQRAPCESELREKLRGL